MLLLMLGQMMNVMVMVMVVRLRMDERVVGGRRAAALIVWLALPERRVVVRDAKAKSSGQTLLRTTRNANETVTFCLYVFTGPENARAVNTLCGPTKSYDGVFRTLLNGV